MYTKNGWDIEQLSRKYGDILRGKGAVWEFKDGKKWINGSSNFYQRKK